MRANPRLALWFVAGLLLQAVAPAHAQQRPLWELGIGLAGLHLPYYRGSDRGEGYLIPFPYIIYRGDFFRVDDEGVQGLLFRSETLVLDLSLAAGVPVPSDQDGPREGMPELDPTVEFGPSLEFRLWHDHDRNSRSLWLLLPLRAAYSVDGLDWTHQGWTFAPYLEYSRQPLAASELEYHLSLGPIFSDDAYHDYFYGVNPAFATAQRPTYEGVSGYSGSRVTMSVQKTVGDLSIAAFLRLDNLQGARFGDSPLLEKHSYHIVGFALSWILGRSETLVHSP